MSETSSSILPVGTHVDQYVITALLGQGGFGITYLVHDELLQKDFALKEFFPEDLVRRDGTTVHYLTRANCETDYQWGLKKFFDEARLLAQFNHGNIIGVRRVFQTNGTAYMVLDLIDGTTLEKWLKGLNSQPTQDELDLVTGPLLDALELVHINRIWHLDISPDNIMIRKSDGVPILLDFGASRIEIKQRSQLVSALVFKSGYSAPEQYTSNADRYGAWTDIYAFGATLYRAISGQRPTEATSRTMTDDLKPASEVARGKYRPGFLSAIDMALKIPPESRPQNIAQWRRSLLSGSSVVKSVVSSPARTTVLGGGEREPPKRTDYPSFTDKLKKGLSLDRKTLGYGFAGLAGLTLFALGAHIASPGLAINPLSYVAPAASCNSFFSGNKCWGAIAEKNGSIFSSREELDRAAAESAAMASCTRRLGADGCNIISTMSETECWALAESTNDQRQWKWATAATLDGAKKSALWSCERNFGLCRVNGTVCADGRKESSK